MDIFKVTLNKLVNILGPRHSSSGLIPNLNNSLFVTIVL